MAASTAASSGPGGRAERPSGIGTGPRAEPGSRRSPDQTSDPTSDQTSDEAGDAASADAADTADVALDGASDGAGSKVRSGSWRPSGTGPVAVACGVAGAC